MRRTLLVAGLSAAALGSGAAPAAASHGITASMAQDITRAYIANENTFLIREVFPTCQQVSAKGRRSTWRCSWRARLSEETVCRGRTRVSGGTASGITVRDERKIRCAAG